MKLSELEEKAQGLLSGAMEGFEIEGSGKIVCCPWLRWRENLLFKENHTWEGILLMQDWGNEQQDLKSAVAEIERDRGDNTIKQLHENKWQEAIWGSEPTWLVTNAVWGWRKPDDKKKPADKCGYLGDKIHAMAFPIWSQVLLHALETNRALKVVFAGSWARFDDAYKNCHELIKFLRHWSLWVEQKRGKSNSTKAYDWKSLEGLGENATAYFCSHPSIWNVWKESDCSAGPPGDWDK